MEVAEGLSLQPLLDKADGKVRYVNPDPAAVEALCGGDGCAAAAEGIEDNITLVRAGLKELFPRVSRVSASGNRVFL